MRPPDYILYQLQQQQRQPPPPPPPPPPSPPPRLWQLPPWAGLLGNAAVLNTPPPRVIQPPPPPQIQLKLPEWGEGFPRRGGTRIDIGPPPQPPAPRDPEVWWREQRIRAMPPGLRELYSFFAGAGNFAVITPGIDVLARWLRREDPTKGLEEFRKESEAAFRASPLAHLLGQGFGLAGLGGLATQHLMTRGAAVGARGAVEQLAAGLRQAARPVAAGGAAGAAAGAAVGVATERDPVTEAVRFGVLGATAGLGATRYQLAAGGLLGGVVGGTTAARHGVEKGIEAGAAVFPLPIVLPERLARGIFAGFATERRPRVELVLEPRTAEQAPQPRAELPTMQDVRMYMLLTRRSFSDVVADMARQALPEQRRGLFEDVVGMALERIRAGYDREAVLAVLRNVRSKLDPASRREFDDVLRQYGLAEVKRATPEYALREEDAAKLARLFRREPEYALTDEAAAALGRFFAEPPRRIQLMPLIDPGARRIQLMPRIDPMERSYMLLKTRIEPQHVLTDRAAVLLDRLSRQELAPTYSLALRTRQEQRQAYAAVPLASQRTAQQATTAPLQTGATATGTTTTRETTTTPPPEPPPGTPPYTPPYIPPWMLYLPVSVALPLLAQMMPWLKLPPPPNPHMPLGAYLRMLRFPALGRQREVFVLI